MTGVRVGQGVDVHPFGDDPDRPLVLGGVHVAGAPGLAGHSDGDVVLHALVDALLGAAGLGDIGAAFGSARPEHAGASSRLFLAGALERVRDAGWRLGNADVTVVGERPRLAGHRAEIAASLAGLLAVPVEAVNLKATTTDGLGFTGRGEGLACLAVVLLVRPPG